MNYSARRESILNQIPEDSICILYSGIPSHMNSDAYYPFEANHHFFYLTGLRREKMILVMHKSANQSNCILYIEEADPSAERWTGKMVTKEEATMITGIQDIRYLPRAEQEIRRLINSAAVTHAWFDCYQHSSGDLSDYNLTMARKFSSDYPGIMIHDICPLVIRMRMKKDPDEIAEIRKAIAITDSGLKQVMKALRPGMKEYQVQAEYEYRIQAEGSEGPSFPTIAGSGLNGCMLHYGTNRDTCCDGDLILLDLGVKNNGYCSDITRTYPINGKYTDRQREVYQIVLDANRQVAASARPGMTTKDLNEIAKDVLAAGCIKLGLIQQKEDIGKYYMHGVSHPLGIDVHDVTLANAPLETGAVITDEPGLYIDEWKIGIRIEDDLLITESGCEVLSESIIRDPDDIEAYMASLT